MRQRKKFESEKAKMTETHQEKEGFGHAGKRNYRKRRCLKFKMKNWA
jgi:hypothetical protein